MICSLYWKTPNKYGIVVMKHKKKPTNYWLISPKPQNKSPQTQTKNYVNDLFYHNFFVLSTHRKSLAKQFGMMVLLTHWKNISTSPKQKIMILSLWWLTIQKNDGRLKTVEKNPPKIQKIIPNGLFMSQLIGKSPPKKSCGIDVVNKKANEKTMVWYCHLSKNKPTKTNGVILSLVYVDLYWKIQQTWYDSWKKHKKIWWWCFKKWKMVIIVWKKVPPNISGSYVSSSCHPVVNVYPLPLHMVSVCVFPGVNACQVEMFGAGVSSV